MNVLLSCFTYTLGLNWSYKLFESPKNLRFSNSNSNGLTLCKLKTSISRPWIKLNQGLFRQKQQYLAPIVKEVDRYYICFPSGFDLNGDKLEVIQKLKCVSYDQLDPKELQYCKYLGKLSHLFRICYTTAHNKTVVLKRFQEIAKKNNSSTTGTNVKEELVTNIVESPRSEGLCDETSESSIQLAIETEKDIEKNEELHMCCFEYQKLKALEVEYNSFRQYNFNLENAYEYEYKRADNLVVMNIMLEKQINEKEATIKYITARNDELNKVNNKNQFEIENLKHSLRNLEQSLELEKNTRNELQHEVELLTECNENLNNANKQLIEREKQLEVLNFRHEIKMSETVASHSQLISKMKAELMRHENKISNTNLHLTQVEYLLDVERKARSLLEIHLKNLEKHTKNLEIRNAEITKQTEMMELLNNELKEQINEKEHICNVKNKELTQCKSEVIKYNDLLQSVENILNLETVKRISVETAYNRFKEGADSLQKKYQEMANKKANEIKTLRNKMKGQIRKKESIFQEKNQQSEILLTGKKVSPNKNSCSYKLNGNKLKLKKTKT